MAETQYSIRVVKQFEYRGDVNKQFSNRYHFDGGEPADSAAWKDLMDGIVLIEKSIYSLNTHIVSVVGYAPGSEVPVHTETYSTAGTLSSSGAIAAPGDCALVLRQATTKRTSKNHVVYCFSYFHNVLLSTSVGTGDDPLAAQKTAVENYGNDWLTGIVIGARTYKRTTPDGHPVTGNHVLDWISHRDFPR